MDVYRISAITLKVKELEKTSKFYSRIPGFKKVYGDAQNDTFVTFEVGEGDKKSHLNLELANEMPEGAGPKDFGRIIFHTDNVDRLYLYMKEDEYISRFAIFESEPSDAPWGERFFHIREPGGYQLSFAQPL
jgi:catechol 2,3-dioxygenase-like lactoylglutathione lyase family enzyme